MQPQAIDFAPRKPAQTLDLPPVAGSANVPAVVPQTLGSAAFPPGVKPELKASEIATLGAQATKGAASITDKITKSARAGDMDEVGKCLNGLLVTAQKYDPSKLKSGGGFLGFFKVKFQELKNQFATVDQQVDALLIEAGKHIALYQTRITDLDGVYVENEAHYHELGEVIAKVTPRIAWMEQNVPALDPNDAFSAQHIADWNGAIAMAKKKVDDMRRQQELCKLSAPMIRMMQSDATGLVDKFGDIQSETIPALKQAFALYIINMEMEKGADFAKNVDDLTNQTLKANAEKLGIVTVKVQTELTRSTIDLATLQSMQASTLKAIEDTKRIHQEAQARIASELPQIEALSTQLSASLAA